MLLCIAPLAIFRIQGYTILASVKIAALSACAAGGLTQTAPEGLVPLDSLPPLRRGMGTVAAVYPYCFFPPTGRREEGAAAANFYERAYYCYKISDIISHYIRKRGKSK